jgi:hypothetical protein
MSFLSFLAVLLLIVFTLRLTFRHAKAWYAVKTEAGEVVGNDGLTDTEREELAAQYLRTAGSRVLTDNERAFLNFTKKKRAE